MSRKMKDSGIEWIGEIPEDWEIVKVKNIFNNHKNIVCEKENEYERLALTLNGVIKRSKEDSKGLQSESFSTYQIIYENDLVFKLIDLENVNTSRVGKSPYTGIVSPVYIILSNERESAFGYYYFLSLWHREIFNKLGGNGVRSVLNLNDLNNLPYPQFDTRMKKYVAEYLDSHCTLIDKTIEKQKQVIEKLKKYKHSVITEAVTKGLNRNVPMKDSGVEWIGEIPEHWEIVKFGKITQIKSNLVSPLKYLEYKQISSENIEKDTGILLNTNTVEESGIISDNHLFFEGQILYSKIRPKLNKATIAPFDGLCSADIYPIDTRENKKFILYIILSASFNDQVSLVTENRVKMPKINQAELSQILITLPTENEQIEIVNYLEDKCSKIGETIAMKELIVEKLQTYKKSLIYECVTGKREVK